MDYKCPESLTDLHRRHPAEARAKHIDWLKSLCGGAVKLTRGDRIEVLTENGEVEWWVYEPKN